MKKAASGIVPRTMAAIFVLDTVCKPFNQIRSGDQLNMADIVTVDSVITVIT